MQIEPANTLQWILWRWGNLHPGPLSGLRPDVVEAMREIARCGTGGLGWREYVCIEHGVTSVPCQCRRRDCPQCIGDQAFMWSYAKENLLLDCPHYHVVFTLSTDLNDIWRHNRGPVADVLLSAAAASLLYLLGDPAHMGGLPAIFGVLHTHGGMLPIHLHGHFVVSSKGLAPDRSTLVSAKRPMLLPFRVLRRTFQLFFLRRLQALSYKPDFRFPTGTTAADFRKLLSRLFGQPQSRWNVRIFRRDDVRPVIYYLSRSVHGGAIRNDRILSVKDDQIRFSYQDWRHGEEGDSQAPVATCTLPIDEFVRRWHEHVPPKGFKTVRDYGLLAPGNRDLLDIARQALDQSPVGPLAKSELPAPQPTVLCRQCGRPLIHRELPPTHIVLSPAAEALLPHAADSPFQRKSAAS